MKYIVAVSGGVDSVVLLDMCMRVRNRSVSSRSDNAPYRYQEDGRLLGLTSENLAGGLTSPNIIVAHVDHGIREDSAADARFVEALARSYRVPFVMARLKLGEHASEEQARKARYDFLFTEAKKHGAVIVTAHHQNDLVETVAINLRRGTGWRGLAVLNRERIHRPLLVLTKKQLYDYALKHRLEWVEDSTNGTDRYLRNRLRQQLTAHPVDVAALSALRAAQVQLRHGIMRETARLLASNQGSRYFLTHIDEAVASELLGAAIEQAVGIRPARPQLGRALLAIKTAKAGTTHHVGDRIKLTVSIQKYQISVL